MDLLENRHSLNVYFTRKKEKNYCLRICIPLSILKLISGREAQEVQIYLYSELIHIVVQQKGT